MRGPAPVFTVRRLALSAGTGAICLLALGASDAAARTMMGGGADAMLYAALQRLCGRSLAAAPTHGARRLSRRQFRVRGGQGRRVVWDIGEGRQVVITRLRTRPGPGRQRGAGSPRPRGGSAQELTFADLVRVGPGGSAPQLRVVMDGSCQILGGRRVVREKVNGRILPVRVDQLDVGLRRRRQSLPLNPLVPKGRYRACTRVGLLDNGVDYTADWLRPHLAYDRAGNLVGKDVWEDDGRPFDYGFPPGGVDPRRSIFSPNRHGTMVASVLAAYGGSDTCIVPVRYAPFANGDGVERAVAFLARSGVRVVSVQSSRRRPWPAFRRAIRRHPQILFVVAAGNAGLDLNRRPLYPTVYDEPNLLVVAGSEGMDRLWHRSNFGAGVVDVAVRAVNVTVVRFERTKAKLSGTSFASPKVAGYAAQLLARQPHWDVAQVRSAILDATSGTVGGIPRLRLER